MSATVFRYSARDAQGAPAAGTLLADSLEAATLDLRRRALFVTSICEHRSFALGGPPAARKRALVGFFRAFATLVGSGITIRQALLVTVRRCEDRRLREALRSLVADVEHGLTLSQAMRRRPRDFSALHVAMIGAGETGGVLDEVLTRIAEILDRDHALGSRLRGALAYPAIVALAAAFLAGFLLVRVVPMFAAMFARFSVPLPLPTRVLLEIAAALESPSSWIAMAGFAAIAALALSRMQASASGSIVLDRARLRAPVLGPIVRGAICARVLRMFGVLLRSGVGLLDALDVLAPVAGSPFYARVLHVIGEELRSGRTLGETVERAAAFDPLTTSLIAAGEEAGRLDAMLLSAAAYLDVEVEAALATAAATVEPFLILALGVVVGAIVFSIFLPLYT